jgi:CRP/FNR family transcriptional regulator, cyclic AMP receptor protein
MAPVPPSSLGGVSMFADLAPDQLEWIAERLHERFVPAGADIITQDEPGDAVFIVVQGSVKVYRRRSDGTEVILSVLCAGEVTGEMSAADGLERWASVAALEESRVLWLDGERFREMLTEMPSVRAGLIELLCRRLRLADARLEALAALDVEGRVASVLLALAEQVGHPKVGGGARIPVPLTQGDVAAMAGASRVRVNQVLAKFRRNGWVTLDGRRRISVRDDAALRARCRRR